MWLASSDRPTISELMGDASRRSFDGVLVWKYDRFARSLSILVGASSSRSAFVTGPRVTVASDRPLSSRACVNGSRAGREVDGLR